MTPQEISKYVSEFTAPNGRVFGFIPYEPNPSLFRIQYVDKKSGELPGDFKDQLFTSRPKGEQWIKHQLTKMWESAKDSMSSKTRAA